MKRVGLLGLAIAIAFVAGLNAQDDAKKKAEKPKSYQLKLKDHNDKEHDTSKMEDKLIVLEWFEGSCPAVVPHYKNKNMQNLAEKYTKKGVVWLAVCSTAKSSQEKLQKFAKDHDVKHPLLMDFDGKVGKLFGAARTPQMFVIKNGKILYQGALDERKEDGKNYVAAALDEALEGKAVSTPKTRPYG